MAVLTPLNLNQYLMKHPLSGQIVLNSLKKNPIFSIPGFVIYINDYMTNTKDASARRIIRYRTYTVDGLSKIGHPDPTSSKQLEFNTISVNDVQTVKYMRSYGLQLDDMTFEYEGNSSQRSLLIDQFVSLASNQINDLALATMNNLTALTGELTFGSDTQKFERPFIEQTLHTQMKGFENSPQNKVIGICLNFNTLTNILKKQDAEPTKPKLIEYSEYHNYGKLGLDTAVTNVNYYYKIGMIPVYIWDGLRDNHVFFVREGSLGIVVSQFEKMSITDEPYIGEGAGVHKYGTKQQYMVHPMGTSFSGSLGTDYLNMYSGPKIGELDQFVKPLYSTFSTNTQEFLPRLTIIKIAP